MQPETIPHRSDRAAAKEPAEKAVDERTSGELFIAFIKFLAAESTSDWWLLNKGILPLMLRGLAWLILFKVFRVFLTWEVTVLLTFSLLVLFYLPRKERPS